MKTFERMAFPLVLLIVVLGFTVRRVQRAEAEEPAPCLVVHYAGSPTDAMVDAHPDGVDGLWAWRAGDSAVRRDGLPQFATGPQVQALGERVDISWPVDSDAQYVPLSP